MTSRMVGSVLTLVILLFSVVDGAAQTYTQMQWGMNKGVTPYAFGANINGTWRDLGTVSATGTWALSPLNVFGTGTIQDVRSYGAGSNVFFVNPGSNLSYYGLPGYIPGDTQRASILAISTSKFNATKAEYVYDFEYSVGTGIAVYWSANTNFTNGQIIHGFASGTDTLYTMTGSTSPCTSSGSGSGPTSTTVGATSTDGTCVWTTGENGITDGKVSLSNAVVATENAGHTWAFVNNLVNFGYIYNGTFLASQETDLNVGSPQDCQIGYANCYTHYVTGGTWGMQTAEIAISHTPNNDIPLWAATTAYRPFWMIRTQVGGTDRIYVSNNVAGCTSGGTPPSGTGGPITDGTCTWFYIRGNNTKAWASHYGILFSGLPNSIKDATINDGSSADDGVIFFGAHANADFNAVNQTAAGTPYFAKLASGQSICFNSAANCLSSTGSPLGVVINQPTDNGGAFSIYNPNGSVANQRRWVFNAAGSELYLQSYSDAGAFQSNLLSINQSNGLVRDYGPFQSDGAATFSSGVISAGTKPTATGAGGTCAAGTVTGGALVGTVALTGNCVSTNTLALTGMPAATTGYVCDATDRTAKAVTLVETTTTTTSATFEFTASSNSGNIIQFKCLGY